MVARVAGTVDACAQRRRCTSALLSGLLGNIGSKADEGDAYQGARGIRFWLHPGSGLAKKAPSGCSRPSWSRRRACMRVARREIEPEWIEEVAGDRVTREYFEPRWDAERGEVVASERVQLYGLTLVPRRRVSFGAIDPATARDVFVREALVPGALATKGAFLAHNRQLVADVSELEHKARRQDVLVDEETIAAFYRGACSCAASHRWRASSAGGRRRSARIRTAVPHPRGADAPRRRAASPRSCFPEMLARRAPSCRSSTASRRGIRWTG